MHLHGKLQSVEDPNIPQHIPCKELSLSLFPQFLLSFPNYVSLMLSFVQGKWWWWTSLLPKLWVLCTLDHQFWLDPHLLGLLISPKGLHCDILHHPPSQACLPLLIYSLVLQLYLPVPQPVGWRGRCLRIQLRSYWVPLFSGDCWCLWKGVLSRSSSHNNFNQFRHCLQVCPHLLYLKYCQGYCHSLKGPAADATGPFDINLGSITIPSLEDPFLYPLTWSLLCPISSNYWFDISKLFLHLF